MKGLVSETYTNSEPNSLLTLTKTLFNLLSHLRVRRIPHV